MWRINLTKVEELPDAVVPGNIGVGRVFTGQVEGLPVVGERYYVGRMSTSPVQEIISPELFRTINSVYKITVLDTTGEA
jgi:hypothetical protein